MTLDDRPQGKTKNGGQGRIRTFEDRSQQIYSLSPLATRAPTH